MTALRKDKGTTNVFSVQRRNTINRKREETSYVGKEVWESEQVN